MHRLLAGVASMVLVGAAGAATVHAQNPDLQPSRARAIVHPAVAALHGLKGSAGQTSSNWSGYVATSGGYTHVSGSWRIPTVTVTADDRYSSTWVGIGGDPTPDLIQAGTEQDSVGGKAVYTAWTEILPQPESVITTMTVSPGDVMNVDIVQTLTALWKITVTDSTTGQSFTRSTPYPSLHTTAEWIHEAPTVGGLIANLAQTSNAVFDGGLANGRPIANAGGVTTIALVDQNSGAQVATPGALDSEGDGFQVADGATAPPAPSS